jgi:hypothetical protein
MGQGEKMGGFEDPKYGEFWKSWWKFKHQK